MPAPLMTRRRAVRPWSPDRLSNLGLRLVASDLAQADASATSSWTDRVAASAFTQATGAQQPLYYTSTSTHLIGGRPCVHFDGVNDLLRYTGDLTSALLGHVFIIAKPHAVAADVGLLTTADEAGTQRFLLAMATATSKVRAQQRNADTLDQVNGDTTLVADTNYLLEWASDGSAYSMRVNNTVQGKTVVSGADLGDWFGDTTLRDNVVVGALKRTTESNFFSGDIAEIIGLTDAISATDRISLNAYITSTYALTLA